ncbi:DNA repair and recombination protein RadA [Candidatus Bathyarchaeota archaeon]|nr:DNA repair and recombination protein RadA [Candidatus Bathyarchaeota archaeon]
MRLEDIKGVSKDVIEKLKEAGLSKVEEVMVMDTETLASLLNISKTAASKIIHACRTQYRPELKSLKQVEEEWKKLGRLSTGSKNLDELLGGGLLFQSMTELSGNYGSGKTQSVFTFSVMAVASGYSVIFIDTERTIRANRLKEIAEHRGINPEDVVKYIYIIEAERTHELRSVVDALKGVIKEFNRQQPNRPVGLVVIDSLTGPIRADYHGRGELTERQQVLGHITQELLRVAKECNCVVVFTNQVYQRPDMFGGTVPVGGPTLWHRAQVRLFYRKSKTNKRIVRVLDAPDLPEKETVIIINEKGIDDA